MYGENLSVEMSLSSLLLRIFIKLLACVPPYGYKTSALAMVSTMRNFFLYVLTNILRVT